MVWGILMRPWLVFAFALVLVTSAVAAEWRTYRHPELGYQLDLPGDFAAQRDGADPATLRLVRNDAVLTVFDGENVNRWSASRFADFVAKADRIRQVTYRRTGSTWFVLSGYYQREGAERDDLIFYTKFMLSADGTDFAAFEISYPRADKRDLDPVIERLERSFRGPR